MTARGHAVAVASLVIGAGLVGCRSRPSAAELAALAEEARRANAAEVAAHATTTAAATEPGKSLAITGELAVPPTVLDWAAIEARATAHVRTVSPHNPTDKARVIDFRGVLVRDLLDELAAGSAATDVTFVARDGFRATVDLAGLRKYRVMLAIEADGQPIPRAAAGPIFLVYPWSEEPGSRVYEDRYWCFYVEHVVVGAEPPRLAFDDRELDATGLARAPSTTFEGPVGWKGFWPSGAVRIRGHALPDVLRAAMVTVPTGGRLVVRGKAAIHRDPDKPIAIAADDLDRCGFVIADRWGPADERIPARMGGPLALAVTSDACADRYDERFWVPFVEELVVERPAPTEGGP